MPEGSTPQKLFQEALSKSELVNEAKVRAIVIEANGTTYTFYTDQVTDALTAKYDLSDPSIQLHGSRYGDHSIEAGLAPWLFASIGFKAVVGFKRTDYEQMYGLLDETSFSLGKKHLEHLRLIVLPEGEEILFPTSEMLEAFGAHPK